MYDYSEILKDVNLYVVLLVRIPVYRLHAVSTVRQDIFTPITKICSSTSDGLLPHLLKMNSYQRLGLV